MAIEAVSWKVEELFLVHSLVGRTRHELLGRWALCGTRQLTLF